LQEQFGSAYDPAGNLNYRTNNALVQTFGANNLNELTNVTRTGTLTVAGTTTATATNVTVADNGKSPVSASLYADRTFARTNVTVLNGNNSYTAIAQGSNNRTDTNSVMVNLPASVSYIYDSNGNLTSDGTRGFDYDDENQLLHVTVTNSWRADFTYDGRMRRRIRKESVWQNSTWVPTAEVHYLYDGMLVIQERDANNLPTVTYTRGRDLSGSLQGAGGIGGLLARTDAANGQAAFYHADGNGNVTAMVNAQQSVVAKYIYDPFGNILSKSGPLADANTYRFSSQEYHQNSGLLLYLRRAYDPNLHRWTSRDPIGERGGIDLFAYAGNNSINAIDPDGTTILVSGTPFPGQEGTLGPYALIINDGSSLVKWPHVLDPKDLFKNELATCKQLQTKSPWAALNPYDEAGFDTPYFEFFNPDAREYYWYNGQIYADNEINYYGIGMYENWAGDALFVAKGITFAWKVEQYGETPTANTYYWLEKGYNDYSGFTDPGKPFPKAK